MGEEIIFVDANIFLEIILDDKQSESCEKVLESIRRKELRAATSDFVIYSCLILIQNKLKNKRVMKEFILLINQLGLFIIRPNLKTMYKSLDISDKYKLDFDDALVISSMQQHSISTLLSLDKDFDKIPLVKRIEP